MTDSQLPLIPTPQDGANQQAGAGGNVWGRMKSVLPDLGEVYLQPLDPSADFSLSDRFRLVMESMRPWGEFFDITEFNRPVWGELKKRVGHNIRTYFYNYVMLSCLHVAFFSLFHFGAFLALVCWLSVIYLVYVHFPDDIEVAGRFTLDKWGKMGVVIVFGLIAIFVGHALMLVFSLLVFIAIVVGIHSVIRDDTMGALPTVV